MGSRGPKKIGMSKFLVVRPVDSRYKVYVEDQSWFGIVMLKYLGQCNLAIAKGQ